MSIDPDAIPNPDAMMVEFGHAFVTNGAMFGSHWTTQQTGQAKQVKVEAVVVLCHVDKGI